MEKKKNGNGNGNGRKWTEEEVKILIDTNEKLHETETLKDIFKVIVDKLKEKGFERTEISVKLKYRDLKDNRGYTNGDGKKKTWSDKEVDKLKKFLKEGRSRKEIYKHFLNMTPLRSSESVRNKIRHLDQEFVKPLIEQTKAHDKKLEEKRKFEEEILDLLSGEEGGKKPKKPKKPKTKLKL